MPSTIETTVMRNITPMQTPMSVKKLLSFWTRMVWRASRTASNRGITASGSGTGRGARPGERCSRRSDSSSSRQTVMPTRLDEALAALVALDDAVAQHDHAAGVRGDVGFVRDHDDRLPLSRPAPRTRA